MSLLSVTNISKDHQGSFLLNKVSFTQQPLQKIAIAGETGSGKTTLMKIVGGLGQADSGDVFFEGIRVKGINDKLMPGHPGIAYLSQHFELHNNYRVEEILAYANQLTDEASVQLYAVCQIDHLLKRKTHTLSGGEKQRVALARLLTLSPRLLLLDEPFSNMDLIHKNVLKGVIDDVIARLQVTCMLISHDPQDMLPWADELLVLRHGEIIQQGAPESIYKHPETEYTAGLFGKYNMPSPPLADALGFDIDKRPFIRPEDIVIVPDEGSGVKVIVVKTAYFGSYYEIEATVAGQAITLRTDKCHVNSGDTISINLRHTDY